MGKRGSPPPGSVRGLGGRPGAPRAGAAERRGPGRTARASSLPACGCAPGGEGTGPSSLREPGPLADTCAARCPCSRPRSGGLARPSGRLPHPPRGPSPAWDTGLSARPPAGARRACKLAALRGGGRDLEAQDRLIRSRRRAAGFKIRPWGRRGSERHAFQDQGAQYLWSWR